MAVPSSGAVSLASIRGELENNSYSAYTSSATSLSSSFSGTYGAINPIGGPPTSANPDAMSEWRAYDHDQVNMPKVGFNSGSLGTTSNGVAEAYGYQNHDYDRVFFNVTNGGSGSPPGFQEIGVVVSNKSTTATPTVTTTGSGTARQIVAVSGTQYRSYYNPSNNGAITTTGTHSADFNEGTVQFTGGQTYVARVVVLDKDGAIYYPPNFTWNSSNYVNIHEWQLPVVLVSKYVYTTSSSKAAFGCGQVTNGTWYFPDLTPAVNDQVYTNSGGTTTPSAGNYGYYNGLGNIGEDTDYRFTVNSSGVITDAASC